MGSLTYEDNQSATLADMHEYVEALERERDSLADALRQLERLATAVAGDAPTEARYGSLWSDLRKAAAEARKVLDKYDGKTERNES